MLELQEIRPYLPLLELVCYAVFYSFYWFVFSRVVALVVGCVGYFVVGVHVGCVGIDKLIQLLKHK